jgi:hypothetical protein
VIRLAFCIDTFQIGGTELNAVRWAEHLSAERFRLTVFHLHADGPLRARYQQAGAQLVHLPLRSLYGPRAMRQGIRLARFLAQAHIDVFHAHDIYSNIFGVPWARLARVPVVVASRRWWKSSPSTSWAHAIANRWAYRAAHRVRAADATGWCSTREDHLHPQQPRRGCLRHIVDGGASRLARPVGLAR